VFPELYAESVGSDSTPSSDKIKRKAFDPRKHLNPVSAKRVKSIVMYKGSVLADEEGKAEVSFKVPDFCGSLKLMVVALKGDKFGKADKQVISKEPLMIEAELPRFLTTGDEFEFPVRIINRTGGDRSVTCSIERGLEIEKKEQQVRISDQGSSILYFKALVPMEQGRQIITIEASSDVYKTKRTIEIPVRAPSFHESVKNVGHIKVPGSAEVKFKNDWIPGSGEYSLKIMSSPALNLTGGLDYLIKYPYGCIEQTTSCVFPLLYMRDIARKVYPDKFNGRKIERYFSRGIKRIFSMQTYSGGFSMWPGYDNPWKWGSIYATDFLVEAESAGYSVSAKEKSKALDYLEKILSESSKKTDYDLKAYAAYVLAKGGRLKENWIRRIEEKKDELNTISKYYLAASLSYINDNNASGEILNSELPKIYAGRDTGGYLRSGVQETAVILSIYMDIDPYNENVPKLVQKLNENIDGADWVTTQDNGRALIALGKYFNYFNDEESVFAGTVSTKGKIISEFSSDETIDISDELFAEDTVKIEAEGSGTLYYYWMSEGLPEVEDIKDVDNKLKVRRTYLDLEGNQVDLSKAELGDLIVAEISIESEGEYDNVLIEDLLPSCFEIENPRLANTEKMKWTGSWKFTPDHIDIRDDRLLLFTGLPRTKNMKYRYLVRVISSGKFVLPPIKASCMYDPDIESINGKGVIKIKGQEVNV